MLAGFAGHGVGGRQDLPLPFGYTLAGAALAVLASFLLVSLSWREPRFAAARGWPLPPWLAELLDSRLTRVVLAVLGLVATAWFLLALLGGPDDALNPSAGVVYVLLWVGVVGVGSALLGPLWARLNPLRSLHLAGARLLRRDPDRGALGVPWPTWLGYLPGALLLVTFAWLELVAPNRATLPVLRAYLGAYTVIVLGGAVLLGSRYFARGDAFEVVSRLFGHLSVLGRRDDGVLVVRQPLANLAGLRPEAFLALTGCVLLGSTFFDAVSSWLPWVTFAQAGPLPEEVAGTLGLTASIAAVWGLYALAVGLAGRTAGLPRDPARPALTAEFAHTLVPVALGYFVAHYYSLLVIVGQQTLQQLSDPLGRGDDWLGIADNGISYALVTPTVVATVQVVAIVGGHVLGTLAAHDRALELFPRRHAVLGQLPLVGLMIAYTLVGLLLLFSS